jgi:hypothetical protein
VIAGSRSAVGAALGPTDLHSIVNLLSGPAANLAAASLQLPAPSLPTSAGLSAAANGTSGHSCGEVLSLGGAGSSLSRSVQLTPEHCLAESVTLRGERFCLLTCRVARMELPCQKLLGHPPAGCAGKQREQLTVLHCCCTH